MHFYILSLLRGFIFLPSRECKVGNTISTRCGSFFSRGDSIRLAENKNMRAAYLQSVNGFCESVLQLIDEPYPRELLHPRS